MYILSFLDTPYAMILLSVVGRPFCFYTSCVFRMILFNYFDVYPPVFGLFVFHFIFISKMTGNIVVAHNQWERIYDAVMRMFVIKDLMSLIFTMCVCVELILFRLIFRYDLCIVWVRCIFIKYLHIVKAVMRMFILLQMIILN